MFLHDLGALQPSDVQKCAKSVVLPSGYMSSTDANYLPGYSAGSADRDILGLPTWVAPTAAVVGIGGLIWWFARGGGVLSGSAANPRGVPTWKLVGVTADRGRSSAADLRQRGDKFRWYDTSTGKAVGPVHASRDAALEYAHERGWHVTSATSLGRWKASDVRATARELAQSGRGYLGGSPSKVYISDVLDSLPGLTKSRLITMHQQGEIELSRLDLTAAAIESGEGDKIKASETDWGNAQFHLIRVP